MINPSADPRATAWQNSVDLLQHSETFPVAEGGSAAALYWACVGSAAVWATLATAKEPVIAGVVQQSREKEIAKKYMEKRQQDFADAMQDKCSTE